MARQRIRVQGGDALVVAVVAVVVLDVRASVKGNGSGAVFAACELRREVA